MFLDEFLLRVFLTSSLNVSSGTAEQYAVSVRLFSRFLGRRAKLRDLTDASILAFMRSLRSGPRPRAERTANNKRQALLTLWRFAAARGHLRTGPTRVPKYREPVRLPQAWTVEELSRILAACDRVPWVRGWSPAHGKALVLTIFDTSHRVGCLLQCERSQLRSGVLLVLASQQKGKRDTLHRLHPQTLEILESLPRDRLLFPWPLRRRAIWQYLRSVLDAAELPSTRRDLFHKIRRTSYTYVYAGLGPKAASEHAAHSQDLSAVYLDIALLRRLQGGDSGIDVLPRPD